MRVLIVQDEPYITDAIRDGLRLEAIAAGIGGDGETALELLGVPPTTSPTGAFLRRRCARRARTHSREVPTAR